MSLYIIYLYLVKNKLHNSTNLENCFFELKNYIKMKRKRIFFFNSNQANYCVWVFCAGGKSFHQNLRIGGSWGWEIQNQPVPPPSDITSFLSFRNKKTKTKRGGERTKKKKTIQETFILLENSSMLHTSERKRGEAGAWGVGGGLTRYKFPTLNISPLDGVFL